MNHNYYKTVFPNGREGSNSSLGRNLGTAWWEGGIIVKMKSISKIENNK